MLLIQFLDKAIELGSLTVIDAHGRTHQVGGRKTRMPHSTIKLHDKKLHRTLLTNAKLALGEAYMDGTLTVEEGTLYDLLDVFGINYPHIEALPAVKFVDTVSRFIRRVHHYNPIGKAQKNVAHHYDLSDTLYDLFLDKDRQYSCAYFATNNDDLEVAQRNKKLHLAAKLSLKPGHKVLDIGSGWGGLALYLAEVAKVDVTGVTLSTEQHKVSEQRAKDANLSDRVRFRLRDYRLEVGPYDRIVSVGMFEHVGPSHYVEFFTKMKELLAEDGVAVLHSIGRPSPPGTTNPWVRKYIFPGGYIPALSETLAAIEKVGLSVTDIEILRLHYAETLKEWHRRFQINRAKIAQLYDERFCRMWEFYLQASEMSFRRLGQMVFQIQLARHQDAVPLTRDYITDWERAHMAA
ncbi:MAG: class I SAM-dependent methyltransferase [Alphaproteobacteria bacterium]